MERIKTIQRHLIEAEGVPGTLSAGWQAFELVMAVTGACADRAPDIYPALTFARGAAVSGRNAVAFAPSLPSERAPDPGPAAVTSDVYEVADAIAELASVLRGRLLEGARIAAHPGDRVACESAANEAERIRRLLAKGA